MIGKQISVAEDLVIGAGGSAQLDRSEITESLKATNAAVRLDTSSVGGTATFARGGSLTANVARFVGKLAGSGAGFKATIKGSNLKDGIRL